MQELESSDVSQWGLTDKYSCTECAD